MRKHHDDEEASGRVKKARGSSRSSSPQSAKPVWAGVHCGDGEPPAPTSVVSSGSTGVAPIGGHRSMGIMDTCRAPIGTSCHLFSNTFPDSKEHLISAIDSEIRAINDEMAAHPNPDERRWSTRARGLRNSSGAGSRRS